MTRFDKAMTAGIVLSLCFIMIPALRQPASLAAQMPNTTIALNPDPCQISPGVTFQTSIATSTTIVTGTVGKKLSWCNLSVYVNGTATKVNIVEGTGTLCATNIAAFVGGGITAATGPNFIANQGFVQGAGGYSTATQSVAADNTCVLLDAANQVNIWGKYVVY